VQTKSTEKLFFFLRSIGFLIFSTEIKKLAQSLKGLRQASDTTFAEFETNIDLLLNYWRNIMSIIKIDNLESSKELDKQALKRVTGGAYRHPMAGYSWGQRHTSSGYRHPMAGYRWGRTSSLFNSQPRFHNPFRIR
jgi:hypothetical protein